MKFTYVLSLVALPLGALATSPADHAPPSLVQRDLPAISAAASSISSSIKALGTAVDDFKTDAAPVTAAAKKLAESITAGIASIIKQSAALSLPDVMSLQPIVETLSKEAESLGKKLEGKKAALQKAGACDALSGVVAELVNGSEKLIKAILEQVPESLKAMAKQLADGMLASIKEGQKDLTKCSGSQPTTSKSAGTLPTSQGGNKTTTSTQKTSTTRPPFASTTSECHCPCLSTTSKPVTVSPSTSRPTTSSIKTNSTTTPPRTTTTTSRASSATLIPPTTRPPTQNTTQPPAQNVTGRPPTSSIITAGGSVFSIGGQTLGLGVFLAAAAALAL